MPKWTEDERQQLINLYEQLHRVLKTSLVPVKDMFAQIYTTDTDPLEEDVICYHALQSLVCACRYAIVALKLALQEERKATYWDLWRICSRENLKLRKVVRGKFPPRMVREI